uniref:Uncharacterized protein n=1 Tax=Anguilla anguilla TaxID=7936 RepID=A0A0E9PLC4_ANGAN
MHMYTPVRTHVHTHTGRCKWKQAGSNTTVLV